MIPHRHAKRRLECQGYVPWSRCCGTRYAENWDYHWGGRVEVWRKRHKRMTRDKDGHFDFDPLEYWGGAWWSHSSDPFSYGSFQWC